MAKISAFWCFVLDLKNKNVEMSLELAKNKAELLWANMSPKERRRYYDRALYLNAKNTKCDCNYCD